MWMLTTLKYTMGAWWNEFKNFDGQNGSYYLNFSSAGNAGRGIENRHRDSAAISLALAVALRTGVYDTSIVGVSETLARARAVKLIRSLAYRHTTWDNQWQSALWAAYAGYAGWLLWDYLSSTDRTLVKEMIIEEADEYRQPLYYRDRDDIIRFAGDSKIEEQAWNSHVVALAAVMMPCHPHAEVWESTAIHMLLSADSHPDDVDSDVVVHGHALSEWLFGSNINHDSTVTNHGILHPDYAVTGALEFNATHIYFLANLASPKAAVFNLDRVAEALIELELTAGTRLHGKIVREPGGTIFRSGTDCGPVTGPDLAAVTACRNNAIAAGESFEVGHQRGCLAGPPATHTNVFYPHGSSWSNLRRPNLAMYMAGNDALNLDGLIDDPTLKPDYWVACFVRDVRAMQARHADGRVWNKDDNFNAHGREGYSAVSSARAWMSYWIQHQAGAEGVPFQDDPYSLEFNRVFHVEAEDSRNTHTGDLSIIFCGICSGGRYLRFPTAGASNSLGIPGVDVGVADPNGETYRLYIIKATSADSSFSLTVTSEGSTNIDRYVIPIQPFVRVGDVLRTVETDIVLYPGANTLTLTNLTQGSIDPNIDRIVVGSRPTRSTQPSDATAPSLTTVGIDSDELVLSYSEVLDETSVPAPGDFAVTVAHSITNEVSTPTVSSVGMSGTDVTLTVSESVRASDTVAVTYTKGTNPIRDTARNEAAGFIRTATSVTEVASEAALSTLSLTGMTISPKYSTWERNYTANVVRTVTSTTLTAPTIDTKARKKVTPADADPNTNGHQVTLSPGSNIITITVTAEDRSTSRTYTVTVDRDAASEAALSTLSLTGMTISPNYSTWKRNYTANVVRTVTSTTLTAPTIDTKARKKVTPADADPNTNGHQVTLSPGPNIITITVTAEDRITSRTYTVTVDRDATALSLSSATVDGNEIVLSFDGTLDDTSMPAAADFSVTKTLDTTTSSVGVDSATVSGTDVTLTLATPVRASDTVAVTYTKGTNPIRDTARNEAAGFIRTATSVTKVAASEAALSTLSLTGMTISPEYSTWKRNYTANVVRTVTSTTLTAPTIDTKARKKVTPADADPNTDGHQVTLSPGPNIITITVTAEDRITSRTYTVTVDLDATALSLSSATVDGDEIVLSFDETLDDTSMPAATDFSVTKTLDTTTDTTTSSVGVDSATVSGTDVTLTLATPMRASATVAVTYTKGTNPIRDTADNETADFTETVTNNTAGTTDANERPDAVADTGRSGPTKPPITGGGEGGGGGPPVVVEIDGPSFAAADTETVFTAAVSDDTTISTLSWTVDGPDGFTATSNAERYSFTAPAGGTHTLSVTVDDTARRTHTGRVTLTVFGDITGHQFVNEILWLAESGITRGCAAHSYCPTNPVTRAQMASFLTRALELETPRQRAGFDDVDPRSAHAANIEALYAAHITTGCTQDPLAYCPSNPVTRAQMATFLARALELEAPPQPAGFHDVDPRSAHAANIEALYAAHITTGCTRDRLSYCPKRPVTRAQMAAFLHRALKPATNANPS